MLHLLLALAPQVPGGFDAGDLVTTRFVSGSIPEFQLIDPLDASVTTLDYGLFIANNADAFDYDSARDRLVFVARTSLSLGQSLWVGNAFGVATQMASFGPFGPSGAVAATGDGRVYFRRQQLVQYLDTDDTVKTVKDPTGANFDVGLSSLIDYMEFDPGTNSLVWTRQDFFDLCGVGTESVVVGRWDLSEDGTQIVSTECLSFDIGDFGGGNGEPKGLTLIEPGRLLLGGQGSNAPGGDPVKTVKLIEPTGGPGGTLAVSEWVDPTPTYAGGSTLDGIAYSYVRDQVVLLNGAFDTIYAYDEGSSSPSLVLSSSDLGRNGLDDIRSAGTKGLFASDGTSAGVSKVSVGTGGQQDLQIDFGGPAAFDLYFVTGSFTGFTPFPFAGVDIPVTLDAYTTYTLAAPNLGPLVNTLGVLDANGRGQAAIAVAPGSPASLVGVVSHHSAIRISAATATVVAATTAVSLEFTP